MENTKHLKFIVVIGASAGGLDALGEMVQALQKGLDTALPHIGQILKKSMFT